MRRDEMGIDHEEAEAESRWWAKFVDQRKLAGDKGEVAATDDGGETGGN